jgi:hypothetical protein
MMISVHTVLSVTCFSVCVCARARARVCGLFRNDISRYNVCKRRPSLDKLDTGICFEFVSISIVLPIFVEMSDPRLVSGVFWQMTVVLILLGVLFKLQLSSNNFITATVGRTRQNVDFQEYNQMLTSYLSCERTHFQTHLSQTLD